MTNAFNNQGICPNEGEGNIKLFAYSAGDYRRNMYDVYKPHSSFEYADNEIVSTNNLTIPLVRELRSMFDEAKTDVSPEFDSFIKFLSRVIRRAGLPTDVYLDNNCWCCDWYSETNDDLALCTCLSNSNKLLILADTGKGLQKLNADITSDDSVSRFTFAYNDVFL